MIESPGSNEYGEYYTGYIGNAGPDVVSQLREQLNGLAALTRLPETAVTTPPAPEEWTIKQVLAHLIDSERVFCYRAIRFSRGDERELHGFEQEPYVAASRANERALDGLVRELSALREATILAFDGMDDAMLARGGVASDMFVTVRALAHIIAGHFAGHWADQIAPALA